MSDLTLSEAVSRYSTTLKDATRQSALAQLKRFQDWFGGDKLITQMRGHDLSLYAEGMGPATPDNARKAEHIRGFLQYLKKEGLLEVNLAPHLRLKKNSRSGAIGASAPGTSTVELTREGVDALQAELESLVDMRPAIREDIRHAMLDKDFRENAPLDAAKDKQGHVEARIREIEAMLKRAVVVDSGGLHEKIKVGTTVIVRNLDKDALQTFMIVGPTEANAAEGKISSVSPVGKALLERVQGDEIEVAAPSGVLKFRVEEIVHR